MSGAGRVNLEPAWVLHRRPYRDTSEIVDLFTPNHGRVGAVARGSRRARRRMPLELFQPLHVSWAGKGELVTLAGAEPRGRGLEATGRRLLSMFYVNELVLRLTLRQDPHPDIFATYESTVYRLAQDAGEAKTLRLFERDLLDSLGYGLLLDRDVEGAEVRADCAYQYRLEEGPRRAEGNAGSALRISGRALRAIHTGCLDDATELREARLLLTAALDHYLGGRPLKTRQFLNALRSRASGSSLLAK